MIPAFGIADYRAVVRTSFGDPVITFFIGVLILAAAFTQSGLGTRLTYLVLRYVGTSTSRVLLGFLIVGTLISMWITDIAVARESGSHESFPLRRVRTFRSRGRDRPCPGARNA